MIKRLIYDVDDTLITNYDFNPAKRSLLEMQGIYTKHNLQLMNKAFCLYEQQYNNYNVNDYRRILEEYLNIKLSDTFMSVMFHTFSMCANPKDDKLIANLDNLSKKYELVLLTNYFETVQRKRLERIGINKYFKECYGEFLIKPNEEAYFLACGTHNPEECAVIGDNLYLDVERPMELGLYSIWVNTKHKRLKEYPPYYVKSVKEIDDSYIKRLIKH